MASPSASVDTKFYLASIISFILYGLTTVGVVGAELATVKQLKLV